MPMLTGESVAAGAKGDCARSPSLDTPKRKPPAPPAVGPGAAEGPAQTHGHVQHVIINENG